jgi:hypothetical protein
MDEVHHFVVFFARQVALAVLLEQVNSASLKGFGQQVGDDLVWCGVGRREVGDHTENGSCRCSLHNRSSRTLFLSRILTSFINERVATLIRASQV